MRPHAVQRVAIFQGDPFCLFHNSIGCSRKEAAWQSIPITHSSSPLRMFVRIMSLEVKERRKEMRKFKILSVICVLAVATGLFGAPSNAPPAVAAPPASIVYNLYATDAFVPLADGSAVYNYGFVGGRQGVSLTYQKSVTPSGDRDPVTQLWTS